MEENSNPTPNINPEPTPAPVETPAVESTPVSTPEPALAPTPEPIATPVAPATTPKKKMSGGLIGLIIGLAVLLIGGGVFAFLYFTSHTPEKVLDSAMVNLRSLQPIALNATSEVVYGDETYQYTLALYEDGSATAYMRMSGISDIYKAMLTAFGMELSDETTTKLKSLDDVWWGIDTESGYDYKDSLLSGAINTDFSVHSKILAAYKKYPFLIVEQTTGNYNTSGTAYKISVDKSKYEAYCAELKDDNITSLPFGPLEVNDETENFVVTITSSFLGSNSTITGMYQEKTNDSQTTKITVDFEHAAKTAPTDAKDISEMQSILSEIMGGGQIEEDTTAQSQRDTQRRNDYAALSASITTYITNNRGQLPAVGKLDATKFINATGTDPSGYAYALELVDYADEYEMSWGVNPGDDTNVYVVWHATCDSDNKLAEATSARAFAIAGSLEDGNYYCSSSQ